MNTTIITDEQKIWDALQEVKDPEIPVISVVEMGIITNVHVHDNSRALVVMTPTFVGCPAIAFMKNNVCQAVEALGFDEVDVQVDYETPWNSNRISEAGKEKLEKFGLAAPGKHTGNVTLQNLEKVKCSHCGSTNTSLNSPFGPTLCRALHHCFACRQGFEQFKPV